MKLKFFRLGIRNHFHIKSFVLSLALKERLKTRKWPIGTKPTFLYWHSTQWFTYQRGCFCKVNNKHQGDVGACTWAPPQRKRHHVRHLCDERQPIRDKKCLCLREQLISGGRQVRNVCHLLRQSTGLDGCGIWAMEWWCYRNNNSNRYDTFKSEKEIYMPVSYACHICSVSYDSLNLSNSSFKRHQWDRGVIFLITILVSSSLSLKFFVGTYRSAIGRLLAV